MALFPERGETQLSSNIEVRPTTPEIPTSMQKSGVVATTEQFSEQVIGDDGQNVLSATLQTVEIPATLENLRREAKGSTTSSSTWFGAFWLRIMKVAQFLGWRVTISDANAS